MMATHALLLLAVGLPTEKNATLYVDRTVEHNLYYANAAGTCRPNNTHGCLDSTPYDYAKQFPCGSHGVFNYDEESCCEQGRPFDTSATYCCTGSGQRGLHSYNDGKCDLSCPDGCQCYDAIANPKVEVDVTKFGADALIDTSTPPEGGYLCDGSQKDGGCLNGWPYNYSSHAPCGSWLMEFQKYGCCPGGDAGNFLPYPFGMFYCCKVEGAEPGKDYQLKSDPCQCHRYGCD